MLFVSAAARRALFLMGLLLRLGAELLTRLLLRLRLRTEFLSSLLLRLGLRMRVLCLRLRVEFLTRLLLRMKFLSSLRPRLRLRLLLRMKLLTSLPLRLEPGARRWRRTPLRLLHRRLLRSPVLFTRWLPLRDTATEDARGSLRCFTLRRGLTWLMLGRRLQCAELL
jgi:hypothetical protein